MRTLKDLIKNNNSTIWIYCENKVLQEKFLEHAGNEGFQAINRHKPKELLRNHLYVINDDMTIGYLAKMIWWLTFQTGKDTHIRIDYGKYISNKDEFICKDTCFKRVGFSDWNKISYVTINSKEFCIQCDTFINGQSFEEYQAYIYRYLIESSWNYTPERAVKRIEDETDYITKCYIEKIPVSECAIEVGFSCG